MTLTAPLPLTEPPARRIAGGRLHGLATVRPVQDKRVLSNGTRTVELYLIEGTVHDDAILIAQLPMVD
jgi:hypothetical protein